MEKLQVTIARIQQMEQLYDEVMQSRKSGMDSECERVDINEKIRLLAEYYENGLWLHDYECDEQGELPSDLKRGVLSQDALYNLLDEENT